MDYVERIEYLTKFDWYGAIRDKLMTSMKKNNENPMKATGCAMALLVNFYYLFTLQLDFHNRNFGTNSSISFYNTRFVSIPIYWNQK